MSITELETLGQEIADNDHRWNREAAKTNAGTQRLTCGQPSSKTPFPQVSLKREDLPSCAKCRSTRARRPRGDHAGVARCSAIELPPSTTRYCPVM